MNDKRDLTVPVSVKGISTTRNTVETAIGRAKRHNNNTRWGSKHSAKDKNIPKWPDR